MQGSKIYANAIISARTGKLLTPDRIKRMLDAVSAVDAVRVLYECGYDESIIADRPQDIDMLIADETAKSVALFVELCADRALHDVVLKRFDYHNAKVFIKARATGETETDALYPFGLLPAGVIEAAVTSGDVRALYKGLGAAVDGLGRAEAPTAREIDTALDKAYYADVAVQAKRIGSLTLRNFYAVQADVTRLTTVLRARRLGFGAAETESRLLPGGRLSPEAALSLLTADAAGVNAVLAGTAYAPLAAPFVAAAGDGEALADFERTAAQFVLAVLDKQKDDLFTLTPVFYFLQRKLSDLKVVKLILTGKNYALDKAYLHEAVRRLYGEL
ncbi:MAG: V-type ATPase subunit [Clostridiales bacterium]|nr:V-type ATPase subunit [Clostridiales bacterium]